MQKIMCAVMLVLTLALPARAAEVEQLGQAEEGGFVFKIGAAQVLIKIAGDVTAEITPDALILRPGLPAEGPAGAANVDNVDNVDKELGKKPRK